MEERLKEYYIDNVTLDDQVITLSKETDCGVYQMLDSSQIIPAGEEIKIVFPSDGIYKVYNDEVEVGVAKNYVELFNSFITYVSAVICGNTSCITKNACIQEEISYLDNAYSKGILYVANMTTRYDQALLNAIAKIRCSASEVWNDIAKQETLTGLSNTAELTKIELALLYMELRAKDISYTDPVNYEELDKLYKYTELKRCIKALGVVECEVPEAPGGISHEATLTVNPIYIPLGTPSNIIITYTFNPREDEFIEVIDSNVPNVSLLKFNGLTQQETITGVTNEDNYYITYSYKKGGEIYQNKVEMRTIANPPQWFGGESTTADFSPGGVATVATVSAALSNIAPVYQETSNGSSSNTDTTGKYIWWVTMNPIDFYIGAFKIPVGPWTDSCDPTSYAIITKTVPTTMGDGSTVVNMNYYRTCPLQTLYGQTLEYNLKDKLNG